MDRHVTWRRTILDAIDCVQAEHPDVADRAIAVALIIWALEMLDDDEHLEAIADAIGVYRAGVERGEQEELERMLDKPPDGFPPLE